MAFRIPSLPQYSLIIPTEASLHHPRLDNSILHHPHPHRRYATTKPSQGDSSILREYRCDLTQKKKNPRETRSLALSPQQLKPPVPRRQESPSPPPISTSNSTSATHQGICCLGSPSSRRHLPTRFHHSPRLTFTTSPRSSHTCRKLLPRSLTRARSPICRATRPRATWPRSCAARWPSFSAAPTLASPAHNPCRSVDATSKS